MSTVKEQVLALTKLKPKDGESSHDFTMRAVKKLHGSSDEEWEKISDPVQAWVNDTMLADEKDAELDLLEVPEVEAASEAEPESETATEESEAEAEGAEEKEQEKVVESKSVKKSNGKKPAKVKVEKKVSAKKSGETRGRKGTFPLDAKIKVLAKENPKRSGSAAAKRFSKYADGKTVAELLKAGVQWGDLRWDSTHEHIRIS